MAYAILRAAKLKTPGNIAGSVAHTFRTRETPNADAAYRQFNEHVGATTPEAVREAIAARLPEKRRSDAVLCIEYFVGFSPEAFRTDGFRDRGKDYFADALNWMRQRHGAENVISAHIHRDETTPHMVVYVVPRDGDKLNAKKWLGGKAVLSKMQTDFAASVGARHGLERGIEGSKAEHVTIQKFYGDLARVANDVPRIDPADMKPQRQPPQTLTDRLGLTRLDETPEQVADRLTGKIREAVGPAVTRLRTAERRERDQARALARATKALADLREKVGPILELSAAQFERLIQVARQMVEENRREAVQRAVQKPPTPRRGPRL